MIPRLWVRLLFALYATVDVYSASQGLHCVFFLGFGDGFCFGFFSVFQIVSPCLFLFCSSGVPAVVDFAAMRDAVKKLGGDPEKINPICPADLVIDHSIQVDFNRR